MTEEGTIEISPRAVAIIAAEAVSECYGVVGMAPRSFKEKILAFLRRSPATKGVRVSMDKGTILVELYVVIEYGTRIVIVANNVISAVRFRLEQALGTSSFEITVFVEDIRIDSRGSGT